MNKKIQPICHKNINTKAININYRDSSLKFYTSQDLILFIYFSIHFSETKKIIFHLY